MPAPLTDPQTRAVTSISDLPADEQASLQQAIREAAHAVQPIPGAAARQLPQNQGAAFFAANPGQQLTARFLDDGGVRFGSGLPGVCWQASLRLKSAPAGDAWSAEGDRAARDHGAITEWYRNRPEGFEHGFQLNERPSAEAGPAVLRLLLSELRAEPDPEGAENLVFVDPATDLPVLGYRDLKVWDAGGRQLAAHMHPAGDGVVIAINDRDARYPLTVDPLVVSLEQRLTDPISRNGALFGDVVALDGDTAVIGEPFANERATGSGAVSIFTRSGSVWSLQQKLISPDNLSFPNPYNLASFGSAVALSGDTLLIASSALYQSNFWQRYVHVYNRTGGVWTQQSMLDMGLLIDNDYVDAVDRRRRPLSLALSGTAFVFSYGTSSVKMAMIYRKGGDGSWTKEVDIPTPAGTSSLAFGHAVAISNDV
ncbi:MAG: hypothetical protein JWO82_4462, partial [Akkermansiaceae bacterium]|nr:hypothetical protein [Akkermansiaceae bacterium]